MLPEDSVENNEGDQRHSEEHINKGGGVFVRRNKPVFPFGQPVRKVVQTDRTPKRVFVLGVYASAVHARWIGTDNKTIVQALAVASEPYIFWRGENADAIIQQISIPGELGRLEPASQQYNGPSGIALDQLILYPLGLDRSDAWLCDLVPHSCLNPSQKAAIERAYSPLAKRFGLPETTVPPVPKILANDTRREEILGELSQSRADTLILLGDQPIKWFLYHIDNRWKRLSDFGRDNESYGRLHHTIFGNTEMQTLSLAHPRQIAKLGRSSAAWYDLHQVWSREYANRVFD